MSRYIEADAFAEKMKRQYCECCDNYHGIRCKSCSCGDWLDDLDSEPTADVRENVKAEWIKEIKHHKDDEQEYDYYDIYCSACGGKPEKAWHLTDYCPNCGAQMMRGEA